MFLNLTITRIDAKCYRLVINYENRTQVFDFDTLDGALKWCEPITSREECNG